MNQKFNNPIIYFFAKSNDVYFSKLEQAKYFCEVYQIDNNEIYYDVYERNNLKYKNKLNKILLSKNDIDLCILSINDLGRDLNDLTNIMKLCNVKHIRLFDIQTNDFINIDLHLLVYKQQQLLLSKNQDKAL